MLIVTGSRAFWVGCASSAYPGPVCDSFRESDIVRFDHLLLVAVECRRERRLCDDKMVGILNSSAIIVSCVILSVYFDAVSIRARLRSRGNSRQSLFVVWSMQLNSRPNK